MLETRTRRARADKRKGERGRGRETRRIWRVWTRKLGKVKFSASGSSFLVFLSGAQKTFSAFLVGGGK